MTGVVRLQAPTTRVLFERALREVREPATISTKLRAQLGVRLADVLGVHDRRRRRLDAYVAELGPGRFLVPFTWTTRASRRPLGTAAARLVASGAAGDPLTGARDEIDRLCDRASRGLARRGALGTWLAASSNATRSLCVLEAATWSHALLRLVESPPAACTTVVGVPDAWFDVPGTAITLHGRRDAELHGPASARGRAVLRVRGGIAGPTAVDGLLVDALVDALAEPTGRLVSSVVGVWPDEGSCLVVEFDHAAVIRAARVVVASATTLAEHDAKTLAAPVAA